MTIKTHRLSYLALTLICAALLGFGYYLQFVKQLEPCPLCIFQRLAYFSVGIIAFIAFIHAPAKLGSRIYSGLISIAALTGAAIAGRQVWLQHLPADQVPECGPGLEYMLEVFSFGETLQKVFTGSGECAEIAWSFLSLSIAEWSLLWLIALSCLAIKSGTDHDF